MILQGDAETGRAAPAVEEAIPDDPYAELTHCTRPAHAQRQTTSEILPCHAGLHPGSVQQHAQRRAIGPTTRKIRLAAGCVRAICVEVPHRQPYDSKDDINNHTLVTGRCCVQHPQRAGVVLPACALRLTADVKKSGPQIINPFYAFVINAAIARSGFNARYNVAIGAMGSRKQGSKNIGRTIATQNTPLGDISDQRMMRRSGLGGDASSASVLAPRQRREEEYGVYAPLDTPDGAQVGLTNIALLTQVRVSASTHYCATGASTAVRVVPGGQEQVPAMVSTWPMYTVCVMQQACSGVRSRCGSAPTSSFAWTHPMLGLLRLYADAAGCSVHCWRHQKVNRLRSCRSCRSQSGAPTCWISALCCGLERKWRSP